MRRETDAEPLDQLGHLDARILELRGARSLITYDLEWALKERDRLARHLVEQAQNDGAA